MAKLAINNLDFAANKEAIKTFLKSQEQFKDYDFTGSNLNVLLDILAYNTYQNNFYGNMLFSEMFLDSAQTYGAIASHAKELNYLPRSVRSSKAVVTLVLESATLQEIVIPKGTRFTTTYDGRTFTFYTRQTYIASRVPSTTRLEAKCIEIFEGTPVEEFLFKPSTTDSVELSNNDVDTDTIEVAIESEVLNQFDPYVYKTDIFGVEPTDKVFYLEINYTQKYALVFGRNRFGVEPGNQAKIRANYFLSQGAASNGASTFNCTDFQGSRVITITRASGGAPRETIEEIRFNAPRSIQSQNRAVTSRDYEILLRQRYPQIRAISVLSGDELSPPQFGKVGISVDLNSGARLSSAFKSDVVNFLQDKAPVGIKPLFIDPLYMYAKVEMSLFYDQTKTTRTITQLETLTKQVILSFADEELSEFGSVLLISKLLERVNESAEEILGAAVNVSPVIEYSPPFRLFQTPTFNFGAELIQPYPFDQTESVLTYVPAFKSTSFVYDGADAFLQDDGKGNIQILSSDIQSANILEPSIGTIDYSTGVVKLVNLSVDSYIGSSIRFIVNTKEKNIFAPKTHIFRIKAEDITVSVKKASSR